MNRYIEEAIHELRVAGARYAKPLRYYDGSHDLAFATEKFATTFGSLFREFALNLCPAVCDAIRDKLRITSFACSRSEVGDATRTGDALERSAGTAEAVTRAVEQIWRRSRMQLRAAEVHREALIAGDAYVVVWPDAAGGAAIYPHRAAACTVTYDDERPGQIIRAAKFWRTHDRLTRLNLFFPDRIERYVTGRASDAALPEARDLIPFRDTASGEQNSELANPFGIVPVFHFANNAATGAAGRSELHAAIPVQDGLNKSVLDMLVAMEYSAYRQRWAAGIEVTKGTDGEPAAPFKAGVDHLWIAESPNARFGDFGTANLDQFLKVKDSFRIDMASVTGTPMYYLLPHTRGFPSGEAMQRAESRFTAKVRDRQSAFGQTWSEAMAFAARIEGHGGVTVETRWEDPTSTTERERLESIVLRKQIGLSTEKALAEAGY